MRGTNDGWYFACLFCRRAAPSVGGELRATPTLVAASKMGGYVARLRKRRSVYRGLVRKLEGKRPLGRPRRKWG
jgi:hypothetical protein